MYKVNAALILQTGNKKEILREIFEISHNILQNVRERGLDFSQGENYIDMQILAEAWDAKGYEENIITRKARRILRAKVLSVYF